MVFRGLRAGIFFRSRQNLQEREFTLSWACKIDELYPRGTPSGGPGAAGTRQNGPVPPSVDAAGAVSGRAAGPAAGDGRQDHQRVHQDEPAPVLRHIPGAGVCGPARAPADPAPYAYIRMCFIQCVLYSARARTRISGRGSR